MYYPLRVVPIYKDYIWGGRNLKKYKAILPEGIIAESWELSCLENNDSIISNGNFKGKSLKDVIFSDKEGFLGHNYAGTYETFPLLFKLIDAYEDLSIQVHPDDKYAEKYENGQLGKTELWYVLEAKNDSSIIYGFKDGLEEDYIKKCLQNNKQNGLYNEINVNVGDVIYIPAGTVHAIKSGLIIAEIQQCSDLTYRIFDYNRIRNGVKRELHINKALEVINYKSKSYIHEGLLFREKDVSVRILSMSRFFSIREVICQDSTIEIETSDCFNVLMVIDGTLEIIYDEGIEVLKAIETVFIPARMKKYSLIGSFKILIISLPIRDEFSIEALENVGFEKFTSESLVLK